MLGSTRVLTDEEGLGGFRDPFQFATWEDNTASAVLSPTTVEEIQEIVRTANRPWVPLWTHGQGRNNGYGGPAPQYRAHLDFMDLAADQYSFGDHACRRFRETLKDALDPNGILSPGKQGIWPAPMRDH